MQERDGWEDQVPNAIDKDFGELIYLHRISHVSLIRLPDVRGSQRIVLLDELIDQYRHALEARVVLTIRGERSCLSRPLTS